MCARLADRLPRHQSELLLGFAEYVETWAGLVEAGLAAVAADDAVRTGLGLDDEGEMRLSVEASLALCFDAMRVWRQGRRLSERFNARLERAVVAQVGERVVGLDAAEDYVALYRAHVEAFTQLVEGAGAEARPGSEGESRSLAALARYVVARCSGRPEEQNVSGMQSLAVHLARARELFARLDANSIPDGNTLLSRRPRFIVREELPGL